MIFCALLIFLYLCMTKNKGVTPPVESEILKIRNEEYT